MNVLQYADGTPVYDLAGDEITAAVTVKHKGKNYKIYPTLSPYRPAEMKTLRGLISPSFSSQDDGSIDMIPGDTQAAGQLTDKHFIRLYGLTRNINGEITPIVDPVEQKKIVDSNADLKARISVLVYGNVSTPEVEESEALDVGLLIDDLSSDIRAVDTEVKLYDEQATEERTVKVTHNFRSETQADLQKYRKASGQTTNMKPKKGVWRQKHNFTEIETLYDSMILSLSGVVINGKPCDESNQKEWLPLVPFFYKEHAIDRLFETTALKNA